MRLILAVALYLASYVVAAPIRRAVCTSATGDAPYSLPCSTYEATVECPSGIKSAAGGIVLLVHGTTSTPAEIWKNGPYVQLLPSSGPGFDVCWITLPGRALGDAQVSSEYVAYAVTYLAAQSATGTVSLIGHSQGAGLNIPWALQFWPSIQGYVTDFIALAGDFRGTVEAPLACVVLDLLEGGCEPSLLQQATGSHFLAAQNKLGDKAFVTTTSIYTLDDEVITPETGTGATSVLAGATNIYLQQSDVCGATHVVDHAAMPVDPAAYYLAVDALTHTGAASTSRFDDANCSWEVSATLERDFSGITKVLQELYSAISSALSYPKVKAEPLLMAYVCAAGSATSYCATL